MGRSQFWDDLDEDMKDPEFRASYIEASQEIARVDEVAEYFSRRYAAMDEAGRTAFQAACREAMAWQLVDELEAIVRDLAADAPILPGECGWQCGVCLAGALEPDDIVHNSVCVHRRAVEWLADHPVPVDSPDGKDS